MSPRRRRWLRILAAALAVLAIVASGVLGYYYVQFARLIDERLHGERERTQPRVYARPFELRHGQTMTMTELVERLNDLGYASRPVVERPGEFSVSGPQVTILARGGSTQGHPVKVKLVAPPPKGRTTGGPSTVTAIDLGGVGPEEAITLEAPMLSALASAGREKRRKVPLASIPKVMRDAVLAIEDRRFYEHPGVDVIRTIGAVVTNIKGDKPYLVGGSTLTQQLVKNFFLTPEKTIKRKLLEQFMAVILERRLTKDEILELYLNEVYLGQRGSFAVHGVAEAARLFFGKDVTNLSLAEAATIAGVIQAPPAYSPVRAPERSRERRNVVLSTMVEGGYITEEAATRAKEEPLAAVARAVDTEAPYFVDFVGQQFAEQFPAVSVGSTPVDIYTTLDLHFQRVGQDALRDGLAQVDELLAKKGRKARAQGALLAIDPRTGEILAWVGGRTYSQSQFNRVISARRQPGSVFKPFVYLSAFEYGGEDETTVFTPASTVVDEPTTFYYEDKEWAPGNYGDEYDGEITLRRALAMSRNVATARVAEAVGYARVARLWKQIGTVMQPRPYPSIALGVFEVTPWEVAQAYTIWPNGGELRQLRTVTRITTSQGDLRLPALPGPRRVARPDTSFLVLDMMRSVMNEGTGAAARAAGFTQDAAGKSGTTNELRDAWFVGFTPELLTVVWVGFDDNQALGLSGSQAALPVWAAFMTRALAGHASTSFAAPDGITYVDVDRDTGRLATPNCPRVWREVFLAGTEPTETCELHRF